MEATKKRKIRSGEEFDHLFPKPLFLDPTIKKGATVDDTVRFIPQVVRETLFQTAKLAPLLKGKNVYETCKNIWDFVYNHIAYKKDANGKEQIRSPARGWHDRFHGIDCDCYTVFISSILSNLKINHKLRITKYKQDHFQHIYPIVPTTGGNYITVDCVVDRFNYEEPYSEKQDTTMELEYLNGVPSTNNVDVQDLMGWEELEGGDLGKLFKRKSGGEGGGAKKGIFKKLSQPPGSDGGKKGGKLKNFIHKALHVTNRINPATALIRSGVLISMKLNLFKVAQRLKFAYLTDEQARQKEVDMSKFDRLKKVKEKLEKIFYDAGGKPENLKKAILTGKGNKNHEVSGLGYIVDDMSGLDETSSMSDLLGTEVFYDEGFNGLGELGSATATAASITAATGIIGAIAGLLKGIGNIFPKKKKEGQDFENTESQAGDGTTAEEVSQGAANVKITNSDTGESTTTTSTTSTTSSSGGGGESGSESGGSGGDGGGSGDGSKAMMRSASTTDSGGDSGSGTSTGGDKPAGFWEKNKKWLKPTAIGVTGLGLLFLGYKMMNKPKPPAPTPSVSGQLKGLQSRKKKKGGNKGKKKKQAVAYM